MELYFEDIKLKVVKCKRPKFSNHRGRTWDYTIFSIDDMEYKFHFDTTWGFYYYFHYNGCWWKIKHFSEIGKTQYHLEPYTEINLTVELTKC